MSRLRDRFLARGDRYRQLVAAAAISPTSDLGPRGMVALEWIARQEEFVVDGLVDILATTREAERKRCESDEAAP